MLTVLLLAVGAQALTGCATVRGMGEDVETLGKGLKKSSGKEQVPSQEQSSSPY
ncbi:MAG: hypothetical protein HZA23_07075 [Nitrospirae bacterium]|nr:hypothetical protein [Nitrospirota bacterium]